jgi:hypothetical protein
MPDSAPGAVMAVQAYAGLRTSMALALLQAPVRFGFLSLPASLLLVSLLYPLDARATLAQLHEDEPGAAPRTARREGGVLALYLEPAFRHYFSSNALELIVPPRPRPTRAFSAPRRARRAAL